MRCGGVGERVSAIFPSADVVERADYRPADARRLTGERCGKCAVAPKIKQSFQSFAVVIRACADKPIGIGEEKELVKPRGIFAHRGLEGFSVVDAGAPFDI